MRRRLAILAFVIAIPMLSGCCCGYGCGGGCGYRLFKRPCMFGSCGETGCSSCYGGGQAAQMPMPMPTAGYASPPPPTATTPNQPIPQLSSVPTGNTVPTRILR